MTPILFMISLTLAVVISTSLLIILIYKLRPQRKFKELISGFSRATREFNLFITKKEVVGNSIIGLDDVNDKVLFVNRRKNKHKGILIDLEDIKYSTIKQIFEPKKDQIPVVKTIALQLNFKNGIRPILLTFYDDKTDTKSDVSKRADQVIEWQTLLSASLTKITNATRNLTNATRKTLFPIDQKIA